MKSLRSLNLRWSELAIRSASRRSDAFTLIEMLVVIGIIALIAGLAAPAMKTKSIAMDAGHRQLADDLNRARQLAISTRSTVYVLFMPLINPSFTVTNLTQSQKDILASRQARGYAIFARRTVGGQPGKEEPRYLSEWKELPDGVFISTNKFATSDAGFSADFLPMDFLEDKFNPTVQLPAVIGSTYKRIPYIAYDANGALTLSENGDVRRNPRSRDDWRYSVGKRAVIPLMAGSVSPARIISGNKRVYDWQAPSVLLKPPFDPNANYFNLTNYIKRVVVESLSGRARVEGGEIQ